jgi:hypothetical protein
MENNQSRISEGLTAAPSGAKKQTHIPYGFITALSMIVIQVVLHVLDVSITSPIQYLSYLVFLGGIIMNAMAYSKANDADVTFGQAFGSCFKATAIITIVMFAWTFISPMIFPDMIPKALDQIQEKMSENSKVSEEQLETAMGFTRRNFRTFMVIGAVFYTLFAGALFSVIAAAVARKRPRQSFDMR